MHSIAFSIKETHLNECDSRLSYDLFERNQRYRRSACCYCSEEPIG